MNKTSHVVVFIFQFPFISVASQVRRSYKLIHRRGENKKKLVRYTATTIFFNINEV